MKNGHVWSVIKLPMIRATASVVNIEIELNFYLI